MNLTTPEEIKNLQLTRQENYNQKKTLKGYHVFLVRFIADLRNLTYLAKEKIVTDEKLCVTTLELRVTTPIRSRAPTNTLFAAPIWGVMMGSDSLPCNPLFAGPAWASLRFPMARFLAWNFELEKEEERALDARFKWRPGEFFRLVGRFWRRLSDEGRKAWKLRAEYLNILVPAVVFKEAPVEIGEFLTAALDSLTAGCNVLQRSFTAALQRRRLPREVSQSTVSFFSTKVYVQFQYLLRAPISLLLQKTIFGVNFKKLTPVEIIKRTKKTIVIHISLARRLQELFDIRGTCMVTSLYNQALYLACPQVFYKDTFRYVVDDAPARQKLRVHQVDNQVLDVSSYELCPIQILIRNT